MNLSQPQEEGNSSLGVGIPLTNGPAAAAILSAGAGCFFLGVLSVAADASKSIARLLTFYRPTGPLSGVSSLAIFLWLMIWFIMGKSWSIKTVAISKVTVTALLLLAL
jgi:hypothetical protein